MNIRTEPLREEFSRDTRWTRLHIQSDDGSRKTTVLLCVSHEFLWDLFQVVEPTSDQINHWLKTTVEKWKSIGTSIFDRPIHYEVYAKTKEGMENGFEFLKGIAP